MTTRTADRPRASVHSASATSTTALKPLTIAEHKAFLESVHADLTAERFEAAARTISDHVLGALHWPCVEPPSICGTREKPGSAAFKAIDERSRRCHLVRLAVDELTGLDSLTMEFFDIVVELVFKVEISQGGPGTRLEPEKLSNELIAFGRLLDHLPRRERVNPRGWPSKLGATEVYAVVGDDGSPRLDAWLDAPQPTGFSHVCMYSSMAAAALDVARSRVEFGAPDTLRIVRLRLEVLGETEVQPISFAEIAEGDGAASLPSARRDVLTD